MTLASHRASKNIRACGSDLATETRNAPASKTSRFLIPFKAENREERVKKVCVCEEREVRGEREEEEEGTLSLSLVKKREKVEKKRDVFDANGFYRPYAQNNPDASFFLPQNVTPASHRV